MSKLSDNLGRLRSVLHAHRSKNGVLHLPAAQTSDLLTFLSASVGMAKALELQAEMSSAAARRLPDPVMLPGTNVVPGSMSTRGWTLDELARAIGLRAMGEDYTDIALRLNRPRLEVVRQVGAARSLIRAELWIQPLLAEPRREEPVEVPVPGAPVLRAYRVRPDIDELAAMAARDNTAALMGDPAPGRSALERKRS